MKDNFVELVLTCGSWQEAQKIADSLLGQKLVSCVEFMEVKAQNIKLVMESVATNFDTVQKEVAKLHSYKEFVLQMLPIEKLSQSMQPWLKEELN